MNAAPLGRRRREAGALGAGIGLSSPGKLGLSTSPTQRGKPVGIFTGRPSLAQSEHTPEPGIGTHTANCAPVS